MTSVGSVDPLSAGDDGVPAGLSGTSTVPGFDAPTDGQAPAELLMGFLSDFHAAARQPLDPEPDPAATKDGQLPNRFDAFAPEPGLPDGGLDLLDASDPLPVWPPPPGPETTAPPSDPGPPRGSRLRRLGRR